MKKVSGLELALYILAGIFAIIFVAMFISSYQYLADYCEGYQTTIGAILGEALKYIAAQSLSYIAYALILFAAARIVRKVDKTKAILEDVFGTGDLFMEEVPEECAGCEAESCEGCEVANDEPVAEVAVEAAPEEKVEA